MVLIELEPSRAEGSSHVFGCDGCNPLKIMEMGKYAEFIQRQFP